MQAAVASSQTKRSPSALTWLRKNPPPAASAQTIEKSEIAFGRTCHRTSSDASAFAHLVCRLFRGRRSATIAASLLVPLPDRFDLVVVAHERHDVADGVADQRLRHVGLVRVHAVLRRRLPGTEDRHLALHVAVRERDLRADAHGRRVDGGGIDDAHARDLRGQLADARGEGLGTRARRLVLEVLAQIAHLPCRLQRARVRRNLHVAQVRQLGALLLERLRGGVDRLLLRLAQRRILHQRGVARVLAAVLLERAVALQRLDELARVLLVVYAHDDADGQAALVEHVLEPRAHAAELVGADGLEDLEEKRVVRALRQRLLIVELLDVPVERARMPPRVAQRLVDEAVADVGETGALERVDDEREDARLVVEEEDFAVDLGPVGMDVAHDAKGALAQRLVADGADGARGERAEEQRLRVDRGRVRARQGLERRQDLPRQRRIVLRHSRGLGAKLRGEVVGELLAARAVLARQLELGLGVGAVEVAADDGVGGAGRGAPRVGRLRAAAADDDLRVLARRGPPRRPLLVGDDADHRVAYFAHRHRTAEALQDAREELRRRLERLLLHVLRCGEFFAQHVALGQRHEVLRRRAERHGDALFFFEVEAADTELRIQLRDDAGAAAGHEEVLALVVLQPRLDLLGALDGVRGGLVEAGELEGAREAAVRAVRAAQRLLDRLAALRPELALEEDVGEEADEGVGECALLGLAQRLGRFQERVGVARIAVELVHPERFEVVELLFLNQRVGIVGKPQRELLRNGRRIVCESTLTREGARESSRARRQRRRTT